MIEDKKLGLKVAENKEEAFWTVCKESCEKSIDQAKHEIIIQTEVMALAESKLKECISI